MSIYAADLHKIIVTHYQFNANRYTSHLVKTGLTNSKQ